MESKLLALQLLTQETSFRFTAKLCFKNFH